MSRVSRARTFFKRTYDVPGAPAAAFLAGLVFLFEPAQVYEANEAFFFVSFPQLALALLPMFFAAFFLLWLLARAGTMRWQRVSAAILAGVALASWAGATFFTASNGILDGRTLLVLADASQVRDNSLWFAGFVLLGAALAHRFTRVSRQLFSAFFVVLASHLAWVAISDGKPWRASPAMQRLVSLSPERNVFILVLDTFQSDFFAEILAQDPDAARALQGFTYFPHAVGPAPTTYLAIPTIHSGVAAGDGVGIRELYRNAVVEGSFVAQLAAAGYDAMVVNAILDRCPRGSMCEHSDALVHGSTAQVLDSAAFLLNMAIFRIVPHVLKPGIYRNGAWWLPWGLITDYGPTSNRLLDLVAQNLSNGASAPTVRFLHLYGTHAPARVDEGCNRREALPWTRATAIAQDRCAWTKVSALLDALRTRGLYEQTAIIILADHGAGMPLDPVSGFPLGASAAPLLLAKPFAATGPLKSSSQVVGLSDIAATVCAWTSSCRAQAGHDLMDPRERAAAYPFVAYRWSARYYGADAVPFDNRFELRGRPDEVASWWRLTHLPESRQRELAFAKSDSPESYGFGWSDFETLGGKSVRWAVGSQSDLYLAMDPNGGARLALDLMTHPANSAQRVTVEVNGVKVAEFTVGTAWSRHDVFVPPNVLSARANRILFRFSQSNMPGGGDLRHLAVLFDNIAIAAGK